MAKEITTASFDSEVLKSDKPVVVDFYASWCGPCRMMAPAFDELSQTLAEDYKLVKVNVEQARELAVQFNVSGIPTLVFLKDGHEVGRLSGARSKDQLRNDIESIFSK